MNPSNRPASAFGGPDTRTEGSASECKAIACESRAGKIRALEAFWRQFPMLAASPSLFQQFGALENAAPSYASEVAA